MERPRNAKAVRTNGCLVESILREALKTIGQRGQFSWSLDCKENKTVIKAVSI